MGQAGWFRDPTGRAEQRYWSGTAWTDHILRGGAQATDPISGDYAPPAPPAAPPAPSDAAVVQDPIVLSIGDIGVTRSSVITPNGSGSLRGSHWIVRDMTRTESKIPTWAIVLAIVFAIFCLLGLLFLLAKEQQTVGYIEVSVQSGSLYHVTQVPVSHPAHVAQVRQAVHQAQTMAAAAPT